MEDKMSTVTEVMNILEQRGYTEEFTMTENSLRCQRGNLDIFPDEFIVDKQYRFEGMSDPGDEAIVYAISVDKYNLKGTLVDGYGVSGDKVSKEMIRALDEHRS